MMRFRDLQVMLSFSLDVLIEQDLVSHLVQLMENIATKLKDHAEARKVLKAKVKLDDYHPPWLRIR